MPLRGKLIGGSLAVVLLVGGSVAAWFVLRNAEANRHYSAALAALERRDLRKAEEHLSCYLEWKPNDIDALLHAAQTARRQGDFEAAERYLERFVSNQGSAQQVAMERRLQKVQQGVDLADAEQLQSYCESEEDLAAVLLILEAVIEGKLQFIEEAHERGISFVHADAAPAMARMRRAVDLWFERCRSDQERAAGEVWRGRVHGIENERDKAAAAFHKALEWCADLADARYYLAKTLATQSPREAIAQLESLREHAPHHGKAALLLASLCRGQGQWKNAQELLDEILIADPKNVPALVERGLVAIEAGHPADAEHFLTKAVVLAPSYSSGHLALSRCLHLIGKTEEAKRCQERYRQLEAERLKMRLDAVFKGAPPGGG